MKTLCLSSDKEITVVSVQAGAKSVLIIGQMALTSMEVVAAIYGISFSPLAQGDGSLVNEMVLRRRAIAEGKSRNHVKYFHVKRTN